MGSRDRFYGLFIDLYVPTSLSHVPQSLYLTGLEESCACVCGVQFDDARLTERLFVPLLLFSVNFFYDPNLRDCIDVKFVRSVYVKRKNFCTHSLNNIYLIVELFLGRINFFQ